MDVSQFPEYRAHKVVRAAEITNVSGYVVTLVQGDGQLSVYDLPQDMFSRYQPKAGDYLVIYLDGYMSFSPRQAFVDGYSQIPVVPSDLKPEKLSGCQFRKKPVVIEAVMWPATGVTITQEHARNLKKILGVQGAHWSCEPDDTLKIHTLEGEMTAQPGDWVIRGVKGELYPCKPDIFEATYEQA